MALIALSDLLLAPSFRLELLATLFALPKFTLEDRYAPQRLPTAIILRDASNYSVGGYVALDPSRISTDTQASFLSALRSNESFGVQDVNGDWQPGQSADGYSAAQIATLQTQLAS